MSQATARPPSTFAAPTASRCRPAPTSPGTSSIGSGRRSDDAVAQEDNMTYGDLVARVDFNMTRASPFSYVCNACNRCCRNKAIRANPYEILRLARRLRFSTTEFIERNMEAGGTVLRSNENGNCVFLGEHGCTVHP